MGEIHSCGQHNRRVFNDVALDARWETERKGKLLIRGGL